MRQTEFVIIFCISVLILVGIIVYCNYTNTDPDYVLSKKISVGHQKVSNNIENFGADKWMGLYDHLLALSVFIETRDLLKKYKFSVGFNNGVPLLFNSKNNELVRNSTNKQLENDQVEYFKTKALDSLTGGLSHTSENNKKLLSYYIDIIHNL